MKRCDEDGEGIRARVETEREEEDLKRLVAVDAEGVTAARYCCRLIRIDPSLEMEKVVTSKDGKEVPSVAKIGSEHRWKRAGG
jgi:hypothetical protein